MARPVKNERQPVADMYSQYSSDSARTEADPDYMVDELLNPDCPAANSVEAMYGPQSPKYQPRNESKAQDDGRGAGQRLVTAAQATPTYEGTSRNHVQSTAIKRSLTSNAEEIAVHPFPRKGLSTSKLRQPHPLGIPTQKPSEFKSTKRPLETDYDVAQKIFDFGEVGIGEESRQAIEEVVVKRPKQEDPLGHFNIPRELRSIKVTNSKIDLQTLWEERSDAVAHIHRIDWQTVTGEADETTLTVGIFTAMQESVNNITDNYHGLLRDFDHLSKVKNQTLAQKKYTTELYGEAGGRYAKDCANIQGQTSILQLPARGRSKSRAPSMARG